MNFLALALGGEELGLATARLERLGADWTRGALWPVCVVLREWAIRLPLDRPATAADLWAHLAERFGSALGGFLPILRRRFETVGGLLLLDGLDEVPEARRSRVQIREAIQDFRRELPRVRILATCRTYAYQRDEWRLPGFAEAILAPFRDEQIDQFVERWYRHLAHVRGGRLTTDAEGRAAVLKTAIRRDPHLSALARRPLLLTLMASLHAWRGGNLPEQREALYEQAVDLLLDVWERPKTMRDAEGRAIQQQESAAEWFNAPRKRLMEALEELAFRVHQAQPGSRPAQDIPEAELVAALAKAIPGKADPGRVLEFIRDRVGLLMDCGGGSYAFPHRTFQEYLAARYLARSGFPRKLVGLVRDEVDRWRDVYLLAGALVARGTPFAAWSLLRETLPALPGPDGPAWGLRDWRCVLLSGQLLVETGIAPAAEEDADSDDTRILTRVRDGLERLVTEGQLSPVERAAAGRALGRLGDRRPGVGLCSDGLPELVFEPTVFPAGRVRFARGAEEAEAAIPRSYRLARYPVTVSQFRAFIEAGGYETRGPADARRWWGPEGWRWKVENRIEGPEAFEPRFQVPNHPQVGLSWYEAVAFCGWLTEKLRQRGEVASDEAIRLPHEAEWEQAARWNIREKRPDDRFFAWGGAGGDSDLSERCNMRASGICHTSAVGLFPLGQADCGASDLCGNVWEWCENLYHVDRPYRVMRGGSWNDSFPALLSCSNRSLVRPEYRCVNFGFRCVRVGALALR